FCCFRCCQFLLQTCEFCFSLEFLQRRHQMSNSLPHDLHTAFFPSSLLWQSLCLHGCFLVSCCCSNCTLTLTGFGVSTASAIRSRMKFCGSGPAVEPIPSRESALAISDASAFGHGPRIPSAIRSSVRSISCW